MTTLTHVDLEILSSFIGYGHLNAPIWFIGMEERAEDKNGSLERNIQSRLLFSTEMDLAEGQLRLGCDFKTRNTLPTQTWRWMARIALSLTDPNYSWGDLRAETDYVLRQSNGLGRKVSNGKTLLMDVSPLPAPNISAWPMYYHALYPNRQKYWGDKEIWEKRQQKFYGLIRQSHKTLQYVFAYGSRYRGWYKKMLFDVENWCPLLDTTIEWGKIGEITVVLTPFFGGRNGLSKEDALKMVNRLNRIKT